MRTCYTKEQARINAEADAISREVAAKFRRDAEDPSYGPVVGTELRKAASAVTESQQMWVGYRDQHCHAVMYSYTTGSGGGTAYESCMFNLGRTRVQELRSDFNVKESK